MESFRETFEIKEYQVHLIYDVTFGSSDCVHDILTKFFLPEKEEDYFLAAKKWSNVLLIVCDRIG